MVDSILCGNRLLGVPARRVQPSNFVAVVIAELRARVPLSSYITPAALVAITDVLLLGAVVEVIDHVAARGVVAPMQDEVLRLPVGECVGVPVRVGVRVVVVVDAMPARLASPGPGPAGVVPA